MELTGKSGNILIVEDNANFRKALKEILLSKFPFMFITQAADGREALLKLERHRPDLIFLDIDLPGKSGLVITKEIKTIFPQVVIIILTHHDLPEYREAAYQNGAQYFLSKESTKADEILALVESILSGVKEI